MLLFRAFFLLMETTIETRGNQFLKKKHFLASENHFLRFSCQEKQFFRIYFLKNASFQVVGTDFLASTNHFLYCFSETPACEGFFSV